MNWRICKEARCRVNQEKARIIFQEVREGSVGGKHRSLMAVLSSRMGSHWFFLVGQ